MLVFFFVCFHFDSSVMKQNDVTAYPLVCFIFSWHEPFIFCNCNCVLMLLPLLFLHQSDLIPRLTSSWRIRKRGVFSSLGLLGMKITALFRVGFKSVCVGVCLCVCVCVCVCLLSVPWCWLELTTNLSLLALQTWRYKTKSLECPFD